MKRKYLIYIKERKYNMCREREKVGVKKSTLMPIERKYHTCANEKHSYRANQKEVLHSGK